jgi:hypothetical protein
VNARSIASARHQILVAGRELGSGAVAAIERILPGWIDEQTDQTYRREMERFERIMSRDSTRALVESGKIKRPERETVRSKVSLQAMGICIGLVVAGHPETMITLDAINREWMDNP